MKNYRLSSYIIDVKLEEKENQYMLVHGYTGAIDIINNEILMYLKDNPTNLEKANFPYKEKTWERLLKRGYIVNKTREEECIFVKRIANLMHETSKKLYKSFGFLVSCNCNFRCPYCYESKISDFGIKWSKQSLTPTLIDKAYEAMVEIEKNPTKHSKKLLLYGGEPLLKENKEIVKYIVEKGNSLGYSFHAITNGYDLHEYKELLTGGKIDRIQITIDGAKKPIIRQEFTIKTLILLIK